MACKTESERHMVVILVYFIENWKSFFQKLEIAFYSSKY